MIQSAWMSEKLDQGVVKCLACSHYCKIKPDKFGICGVRKNEKGELKLLVYGKAVAYHTDPVEKKPLYHFYPSSPVFSIGTVGCNFRCEFCQNDSISQYHRDHDEEAILSAGADLLPDDIVEYCLKNQIPAVSYTYNEPAIFFEYAYDIARLAKQRGVKNIYVSNGFETPEALEAILPYLDAINVDLKSFRPSFYRKLCGGKLEPVLDTIRYLWSHEIWTEVTTLIIPGENDEEEELRSIAEFLADLSSDIPWHISRFHPAYHMNHVMPTPHRTLRRAYELGKEAGLHYVYIGNIPDEMGENTYCPSCGSTVIQRSGYLVKNHLREGKCPECGTEIAGRFV